MVQIIKTITLPIEAEQRIAEASKLKDISFSKFITQCALGVIDNEAE